MVRWRLLVVVIAAAIGSAFVMLLAVTLPGGGGSSPRADDDTMDRSDRRSTSRPSPFPAYSVPDREILDLGESFDFRFDWVDFMWNASVSVVSTEGVAVGDPVMLVVGVQIRVAEGQFPVGSANFRFISEEGRSVDPEDGIYADPRTGGPLRAKSEFEGRLAFLVEPSDVESGQVCLEDLAVRNEMRACWDLDTRS